MNNIIGLLSEDFFLEFFNDSVGNIVLCVACVLMMSYLRDVPPKFERKRMVLSGIILTAGAFISRFLMRFYSSIVIAEKENIKFFVPKLTEKGEINLDNLLTDALCIFLANEGDWSNFEYQKWTLILNVVTTLVGCICICAGSFILMKIFRAKHITPMVVVQIFGFALKEVLKNPYKEMISNLFPYEIQNTPYGYNGFAYGCFLIILIILYIIVTKGKYEIFWTKDIRIGKHIVSLIGLFSVYTVLTGICIRYKDDPLFKWIILAFLTAGLLVVPWRTYKITCAELRNEYYKVKRNEKVELYEYSQAESNAIRKYIHDLPKHFLALDDMASKIGAVEISQYIHDLDNDLVEAKGEISTGNTYLDDLLTSELKTARQSNTNIIFTGVFPNEGIKKKDITTVFMNLIDNAIDACKTVPQKREILIKSTIVEDRVFVSFSNPFKNELKKSHGKFKTTKKNKEFHGYGISSAAGVVEKKAYDGTFSTETKDNIFTVLIDMKFK